MVRRLLLLSFLLACCVQLPAAGATVATDPGDKPPPLPALPSPYQKGQGPSWVYLQAGDHDARLMWSPPSWPSDLQGFNVKRRAPGGKWKKLNRATILPTLSDEDIDSRTNDKRMRFSLRTALTTEKDAIAERGRSLDEVLQWLGTPEGYATRQRTVLSTFYQALLFGFGYQDSKMPRGNTFEYGLFGVARDGSEIAQPIAVRRWERSSSRSVTLKYGEPVTTFRPDGRLVQVSWSLSRAELDVNLIREVQVHYDGPDDWVSGFLPIASDVLAAEERVQVAVPERRLTGDFYLCVQVTSYFMTFGRSQSVLWPDPPNLDPLKVRD